jgi:hypothetical protein
MSKLGRTFSCSLRPCLGKGCLGRQGWAGEKVAFLNNLD